MHSPTTAKHVENLLQLVTYVQTEPERQMLFAAADHIEALEGELSVCKAALKHDNEHTLVLPCKMGDPIYWVVTRHEPPRKVKTKYIMYSQLDWHNLERVLKEYGKTVFTTKEEALAALEGAKADG